MRLCSLPTSDEYGGGASELVFVCKDLGIVEPSLLEDLLGASTESDVRVGGVGKKDGCKSGDGGGEEDGSNSVGYLSMNSRDGGDGGIKVSLSS